MAGLVEEHDDERGRDDRPDGDEQPSPSTGVEHLAQSEPDEAGERHTGRGADARPRCGRASSTDGSGDSAVGERETAEPSRPSSRSWCSCRHLLTGRLGGHLEEHLLEATAAAGAPLDEHDARGRGDRRWSSARHRPGHRSPPARRRRPRPRARARGPGRRWTDEGAALTAPPPCAMGDDPAVADDDDVVGDPLDLIEQVRAWSRTAAPVRVAAKQVTHPADTGRVGAVGGLVEDEHLGIAGAARGRCPVADAERVVADSPGGTLVGESDEIEHVVDPFAVDAHRWRRA